MPAGRSQPSESGAKPPGPKRPPWVKEGPQPIPMPTAPWALNKRGSVSKESEAPPIDALPPRRTSTVKITPSLPSENGTPKDPHTFERPQLRSTKPPPKDSHPEPTKLQSREVKVPVTVTSSRRDSKDLPSKLHIDASRRGKGGEDVKDGKVGEGVKGGEVGKSGKESKYQDSDSEEEESGRRRSWLPKVELKPVVVEQRKKEEVKLPKVELKPVPQKDIEKAVPAERNAIVRQESLKKVCPAPPPMPPPPPPPEMPFDKRDPLSRSQLERLESLRARPRRRPDWGEMMKEVEKGRKLKHVHCNDRSQPLLPESKATGQFVYESEKSNIHNQLLKQIQFGANLKHVKTNDRSKPILEGLRKFRRQMTIEEQIQKSQSMANMPQEEVQEEVDEMDDIDKVRDDLQSTKQMLALELRNKEAQIRENKRLLSRLQSLEAEVEKLKGEQDPESDGQITSSIGPLHDKIVKTLKEEATSSKAKAEEMEQKYHTTADQLDSTKNELDEARRQNRELEKKLQQAMQGGVQKRQSFSDRRESVVKPPESEDEDFEPESEDSEGEDTEEKKQRRAERELRLMRNKLKSLKNKQEAAKKERKTLRDLMKKNQQAMKEEKKKYKNLQKEVNKMAALMKDDEEEDEDEEEEEEEEETEEETETESESESSEEEESSESEDDEEEPHEKKKEGLQHRVKRHENCLNALKKGNYMLKANVDRIQDDLNKQKEAVQSLQEDLDSVLSELG